jgi:hypothetical protein
VIIFIPGKELVEIIMQYLHGSTPAHIVSPLSGLSRPAQPAPRV